MENREGAKEESEKIKLKAREYFPKGLKKVLDSISGYQFFVPLIVYFIGFLFVQGMTLPFTRNIALWDFIYEMVPVSLSFYVASGIVYILKGSISILLGCLIWFLIQKSIDKPIDKWWRISSSKETNKEAIGLILKLVQKRISSFFLAILFGSPFLLFSGYILLGIGIEKKWFNDQFTWILILYNSLLFIFYRISYEIIKRFVQTDLKRKEGKTVTSVYGYYYTVFVVFTVAIHIAAQGFLTHYNKISLAHKEQGVYKLASVYTDKAEPSTYFKIDISKDFFIGYSKDLDSISVIPMGQVKKIDMVDGKNRHELMKYDEDIHKGTLESEKLEVLQVIENYYKYRLDQKNLHAKEWIELLSNKYYAEELNLVSPEILNKKWKEIKEFRNLNISDFIGFEMSIPQISKDGYDVYVAEYNKKQNFGIKYKLIREDKKWKINDVLVNKDPFIFVH